MKLNMNSTSHRDGTDAEPTLVLHVDDEPKFGELVAAFLENLDDTFTVVTESDVRAGLDRLDTDPVDCVISDYQMEGMNGLAFLRAVREDYPNLPFLLFTGKGSEEVASDAINAGVTTYLQKDGAESYELLTNQVQNAVGRRRSERRAKVAQDRLLELYEQIDGFFVLDEEWTVTYWNEELEQRTGKTTVETVGQSFFEVFPEAKGTELTTRFRAVMETREQTEFETYFEPNDRWLDVRVYPVEEGLFVHSRDITGEKEREQEMERRNQILESFANTVSHDLRNPLNVAEGRLELAQRTGDFEHLEDVAQAHNRMRNLIDDLLSVARGEKVTPSEVTLRESVEGAWETVSSQAMDLSVSGDATFEAHRSQLRRLFENLFWNALDHGGASKVRVGLLDDGIYVEDDGRGVPEAERETVFESGYSTAPQSPGYGLYMVNGICETHGWDISLTEGADGGARFEIHGITDLHRTSS